MSATFIAQKLETLPRGHVLEVDFPVTEFANSQPVYIPITLIKGQHAGPIVFLTAAVHGDELNGTGILRNLLNQVTPAMIRGTLVVAPIVNMQGFLSRSRYQPDRRDLNRSFPGSATGSMSSRVAHKFLTQVIAACDLGVDFHTAAQDRENFPHVCADIGNAKIKKMAKSFGCTVVIDDPGPKGSLRRAASDLGVPTLLFEGGTSNAFQRKIVSAGLKGLKIFLNEMGILKKKIKRKETAPFQILVRKTKWVRAERGGLLELRIHPGSIVYKGQAFAKVTNPLGKDVSTLTSPHTGLVIGITQNPVVNPGTPVIHIAELNKTLRVVEKHAQKSRLAL